MKYDYLIVGSALFGATFAYKANTDFFTVTLGDITKEKSSLSLRDNWQFLANKLVFTGPVDQYFGFQFGKLDWRTVTFKTRIEDTPNYQGNAVVNYTSHDEPYTRIIEHKHFEMFGQEVYDYPQTIVSEEYSVEYNKTDNSPSLEGRDGERPSMKPYIFLPRYYMVFKIDINETKYYNRNIPASSQS